MWTPTVRHRVYKNKMLRLEVFKDIKPDDCRKKETSDIYAIYFDQAGLWAEEDALHRVWAKLIEVKDGYMYFEPLDELNYEERKQYPGIFTIASDKGLKKSLKDRLILRLCNRIFHSGFPYEIEKKYIELRSLFKYERI